MKIKGIYIVGLVIILFMMTAMPIISNTMTIGIEANDETKRETITLSHTGKTDGIYHTYDEMEELLIELEKEHPDIFHLSSMGKTYQGRDIWMLKISDNVGIDEDEPEVLLMGAHHGNEKPSFEILIFFIEHIANNYGKELTDDDGDGYINEDPIDGVDNDNDGLIDEDPSEERARDVVNNTEIYIVPMVNPDGVEANTRKNQAPNYGPLGFFPIITSYGVDLNRNYDYKWFRWFLKPWKYWRYTSQFNTKSSIYRGEKPFCENETIAVRELVNQHGFILSISYHTYGELILYP